MEAILSDSRGSAQSAECHRTNRRFQARVSILHVARGMLPGRTWPDGQSRVVGCRAPAPIPYNQSFNSWRIPRCRR
ncbi:hypothetical protein BN2475_490043 [Paraburkholderia ribeironis]|uniref:Uncharacterized protein n=1 Tax=Paraburkholderia ribeironis TaxID=1247936 RepID=A0A1N7SBS6_9BURK|nr:hypothetical protein BN2475_490043 [Paraburkholderia ribeironis]